MLLSDIKKNLINEFIDPSGEGSLFEHAIDQTKQEFLLVGTEVEDFPELTIFEDPKQAFRQLSKARKTLCLVIEHDKVIFSCSRVGMAASCTNHTSKEKTSRRCTLLEINNVLKNTADAGVIFKTGIIN